MWKERFFYCFYVFLLLTNIPFGRIEDVFVVGVEIETVLDAVFYDFWIFWESDEDYFEV